MSRESEREELKRLGAEELASADERIRYEMKRRASIACKVRHNGSRSEGGTEVGQNTIVVHAGAQVMITIEEGSPGHGRVLGPRAEGWTCSDINRLRAEGEEDHVAELIASNPGATNAEFTLSLVSYTTSEVHFR